MPSNVAASNLAAWLLSAPWLLSFREAQWELTTLRHALPLPSDSLFSLAPAHQSTVSDNKGESVQPPGTSEARDFLTLSTDLDLPPYFKPRAAANNKHACVITIHSVEQFDHVCVTSDLHSANTAYSFTYICVAYIFIMHARVI